jgi:hypothetical protein
MRPGIVPRLVVIQGRQADEERHEDETATEQGHGLLLWLPRRLNGDDEQRNGGEDRPATQRSERGDPRWTLPPYRPEAG